MMRSECGNVEHIVLEYQESFVFVEGVLFYLLVVFEFDVDVLLAHNYNYEKDCWMTTVSISSL